MLEQYKWFSLDETNRWNHDFNEALTKGNKETIMQLLHNGGKLYLDEYSIYHAFTRLSHIHTNTNIDSKINTNIQEEQILEEIQHCKIVKNLVHTQHSIFLETTFHPIECFKLSDRFPHLKNTIGKYFPIQQSSCTSQFQAEYVSQMIGVPNHVVSGYIYGITSKSKTPYTWVEFRSKNQQEYVIDYEANLILNKEGYYYLRHAEPLKKVSNGDIKGKQVSGFFSYNNPSNEPEEFVEENFISDSER